MRKPAMQFADDVEKRGFAILPGVLMRSDIERLGECLTRDPLPRSRAGMRHALRHLDVLAVARHPRLLDIAREILECDPVPFRPRYLTSLPPPIGSWCGTRTPHCRYESSGLGPLVGEGGNNLRSCSGPRAFYRDSTAFTSRRFFCGKRPSARPSRNAHEGCAKRRRDS
jgi:hypothetical protein